MNDADLAKLGARRLPVLPGRITDSPLCTDCGRCCKTYPSLYVPDDFGGDVELMTKAILNSTAQIDAWDDEGDELGYVFFLRAPMADELHRVLHFAWRGACGLLTPTGCKLPYDSRPRECRSLVPKADRDCRHFTDDGKPVTKRDHVALWKPFQSALGHIIREYA
jgi:hypothetical protein